MTEPSARQASQNPDGTRSGTIPAPGCCRYYMIHRKQLMFPLSSQCFPASVWPLVPWLQPRSSGGQGARRGREGEAG